MIIHSFGDELTKLAKYPISRLVTGRAASGATTAGTAGLMGAPLKLLPFVGARGAAETHVASVIGGRGLAGRIARGGKGMTGHEKKRVAEAAGMSVERLEKVLKRIEKQGPGKSKALSAIVDKKSTMPFSRAATHRFLPLPGIGHLSRGISARGFAGRAARGGKGMTKREKAIVEELQRQDRRRGLSR